MNFPKYLDAIFTTKPENIRWLCGFKGSFGLAIIFPEKTNILISDSRYAETAKKQLPKGWKFHCLDESFKTKIAPKLRGVWGLEDTTTLAQRKNIKKLFPSVRFRTVTNFWEKQRRQKKSREIEHIKTAQAQVDRVLVPFLKSKLAVGVTEQAMAFELEHLIRGNGRFGLSFEAIVAFGENSAIPHHAPTTRKLKKGDNILIDCGAKFEGYCSDMTRNFSFGVPSDDYLEKFENCLIAQEKALKNYKKGANIANLEKIARDSLGADAVYFTHSLGHGVGLEIHEMPEISTRQKGTLELHEVVTCEPGIYFPDKFGIRIEDCLVVGEKGPIVLSQTDKNLIVF